MRASWIAILAVVIARPSGAQQPEPAEFFETRVRPVLAHNCFACHTDSRQGGLRLDSRENILKGGKSGPALVPGKPEDSLLVGALKRTDVRLRMPLGGRLKDGEIDDLASWVRMGAPWPETKAVAGFRRKDFWSFRPLGKPAAAPDQNPAESAIDRFIGARLQEKGLRPVAAADKRTLIRRATFDLTGLPPTAEEIEAFVNDPAPGAFAKVVDRLLASPRYGERWARYWLDIARYGEDDVRGSSDPPKPAYPNAWRYRDWVIEAFNNDLPYNAFVKTQIAGDFLDSKNPRVLAGLGFFGLGPWLYDTAEPLEARANERNDRVDALTRGFLGLTVACARCHDHKYDPITMNDYYALAGVFGGTEYQEHALAPDNVVLEYKNHQRKIQAQETAIKEFLQARNRELGEMLARKASRYMMAAWRVLGKPAWTAQKAADEYKLDAETLARWLKYLGKPQQDHQFLKPWDGLLTGGGSEADARKVADEFQQLVLGILAEKKAMDDENDFLLAQAKRGKKKAEERLFPNSFSNPEDFCDACGIDAKSIDRDKFVFWRELFGERRRLADNITWTDDGVLYNRDAAIDRFLGREWKDHLDTMRAELDALKKATPALYPYLHTVADVTRPGNLRLNLRGSPHNLGDEVPRRFVAVLSEREPAPFRQGSGRLELAEAIAGHPLTARVIANRVWMYHFGSGIVGTPSNFGQTGERPTHPDLLEYLAARMVENGWSLKALHREIMLSSTYRLSSEYSPANFAVDPENRLYWRANLRRLDLEAMRDSLLFVAGTLDPAIGGPSFEWTEERNRRTIYGKVSRVKVNELLALFDFPDPSFASERRNVTNVPLQRLFFLNSDFVFRCAESLAKRMHSAAGPDDAARIRKAYPLLYGREATGDEVRLGLDFLREASSTWTRYAQVLLSSNEFVFVN